MACSLCTGTRNHAKMKLQDSLYTTNPKTRCQLRSTLVKLELQSRIQRKKHQQMRVSVDVETSPVSRYLPFALSSLHNHPREMNQRGRGSGRILRRAESWGFHDP